MVKTIDKSTAQRDRKALVVFLFLITCFSSITLIPIIQTGSLNAWGGLAVTLFMWAPGLAGTLTALLVFRSVRPLGILGNNKILFWAVLCFLLPIIYTLVIYPLLQSLGLVDLGKANMNASILLIAFGSSLKNVLGEELGWRGFAAPVMARIFGFWKGQTLLGIIWFAYHLPALLFTDYGKSPHLIFGNFMFLISVTALSYFLGWVRLQTDSVWPSTLFHASHNLIFLHLFDPITFQSDLASWLAGEQGLLIGLAQVMLGGYTYSIYRRHQSQSQTTPP